ncbi:MAG: FkbM family methyltransferase, partial [Isosphaeraceae bacterium]
MVEKVRRLLTRTRQGVGRRVTWYRDAAEWHSARAFRGSPPWCRNRWGHRYRTLSLRDYNYLRDGNPETHEAAFLGRVLRPGMTVVDAGANHGIFCFEAAHFVGTSGVIHAFEPAPVTHECLIENLRVNGIGNVRVSRAALGAEPGAARFRVHHAWSGLNTMADRDITWMGRTLVADEVIEVPVVTLAGHAAAEGVTHVDFLKIDVEGFELAVLRGARPLLAARAVGWVMFEVGDGTCKNAGVDPDEVLAELHGQGYEVRPILPDGALGPRVESFPKGSFSANFV